jgi:hypothetical protein
MVRGDDGGSAMSDELSAAKVLLEFATNCDAWEAQANRKRFQATERGDTDAARYEEGNADAFHVAAMMARMRAESLADT